MRIKPLFGVLVLALGLVLTLAWILHSASISAVQAAPVAGITYVDADAIGANNGSSWADAYINLQDAMDAATGGDEIWVAEGVYTPTNTPDRHATFDLERGVALYGGFAATETLRTQRDWESHVTVLSGDLDGNDVTDANDVITNTDSIVGDNAYHVVTANSDEMTRTTVLDGFTITGGNADANLGQWPDEMGGGMHNPEGKPTLQHITFAGNYAWYGGGLGIGDGGRMLVDIAFIGNTAKRGGGMSSHVGGSTLVNASFSGNSADYGGGLYVFYGSLELINVTLSGNTASIMGGGMVSDDPATTTVRNSVLWGNTAPSGAQAFNSGVLSFTYSLVEGGCPSGATCSSLLTSDPQFVRDPDPGDGDWSTLGNNDYGDLRLGFASPAIDAGDNTAIPADITDLDDDGDVAEQIPLDLIGNPRFVDIPYESDTGNGTAPIADLGAYEAPIPDEYFRTYLPLVAKNFFTCNCNPGKTMFDPAGDVQMAHIDVTALHSALGGETLQVTFHLRDVPSTLTFNRVGVPKNYSEYFWIVYVDVDNDPQTGSDDFEGAEYLLGAMYFVSQPDSPTVQPIEDKVQVYILEYNPANGYWYSLPAGTLDVDTQSDTMTLYGDIPGISSGARLFFVASDYNPGGGQEADDSCCSVAAGLETQHLELAVPRGDVARYGIGQPTRRPTEAP